MAYWESPRESYPPHCTERKQLQRGDGRYWQRWNQNLNFLTLSTGHYTALRSLFPMYFQMSLGHFYGSWGCAHLIRFHPLMSPILLIAMLWPNYPLDSSSPQLSLLMLRTSSRGGTTHPDSLWAKPTPCALLAVICVYCSFSEVSWHADIWLPTCCWKAYVMDEQLDCTSLLCTQLRPHMDDRKSWKDGKRS